MLTSETELESLLKSNVAMNKKLNSEILSILTAIKTKHRIRNVRLKKEKKSIIVCSSQVTTHNASTNEEKVFLISNNRLLQIVMKSWNGTDYSRYLVILKGLILIQNHTRSISLVNF